MAATSSVPELGLNNILMLSRSGAAYAGELLLFIIANVWGRDVLIAEEQI